MGVDNPESKELVLQKESWVTEQTMKRLVDRTGAELANCKKLAISRKTDKRKQLEASPQSTQAFIQRSLSVDAERMREYRQRLKGRERTPAGKLETTEIARRVSETLARHRGSAQ